MMSLRIRTHVLRILQQSENKLNYSTIINPMKFNTTQEDLEAAEAEAAKRKRNPNVITVPIHLEKRLEKRKERENSKYAEKQRILAYARQGSKSRLVISCKRHEFNHYYGQSYDTRQEIPLASKGWAHRKSAGDSFIINSTAKNFALLDDDSGINFETLDVMAAPLIEKLNQNGILIPTVIQSHAIPEILRGSNCLIAAETGSGKTLAYLIPILQEILKNKRQKRPNNAPLALILAPTRELAEQIHSVAKIYTAGTPITLKLIQGGNLGSKIKNPPSEEIDLIVSTVNVISALTQPNIKVYDLSWMTHIVLDEADTLLDDSFSPQVLNLLTPLRFEEPAQAHANGQARAQLLLVSATVPRSVNEILEEISFPVESLVRVFTPGLHQIMPHVPQKFLRLKISEKLPKLVEIAAKGSKSMAMSMMIFCNETSTCEWLSRYLKENGIQGVTEIHGHLKPTQRKGRIEAFNSGEEFQIICCTDIASRGMDTLATTHVFNYDFPRFMADYVHRCGRTGRVGSRVHGQVTNVITRRSEIRLVNEIELAARKQTSLHNVNANIKRLLNLKYGMGQSIHPVE